MKIIEYTKLEYRKMAEIAKLKKQTTAYKTHLTISINKLSEELNKARQDGEEVDVDLVKQYLQQVELKHEKWETSMLKIQDEDPDIEIDDNNPFSGKGVI